MSSFSAHLGLLSQFAARRSEIVGRIESRLLNVRDKPLARSRDRRAFDRLLTDCFFDLSKLSPDAASLKGQLAKRHLADGFEPVVIDKFTHDLDPLELIVRGYQWWGQHRWPGASGRLSYAQTIFAVFMLRQVEYLTLMIWDPSTTLRASSDEAAGRNLDEVQALLDRLNAVGPVLVRDARWLMQTAQGPLTRRLAPYFDVADRVLTLPAPDRVALHAAGAVLAGGHLRSQIRYRVWNAGRPADDPELVAFTRNSNSMDTALLVRDLVGLLEPYLAACAIGNRERRLELADAILQGLSADAELLLVRLDLLGPYTSIENLFFGGAHADWLTRYRALVSQAAPALRADAAAFAPGTGAYSPYGISYGFIADVLANAASDTLVGHPLLGLSLEDLFESRNRLEDKAARAAGWARLPRREGEREHFDHSLEWAADVFARLTAALDLRVAHGDRPNASTTRSAKLLLRDAGTALPDGAVSAQDYCLTSDMARALAIEGIAHPAAQILVDRDEARFLGSVELDDGQWFAVSKLLLTMIIAQGRDAQLMGLPTAVIDVLRLTCPELITVSSSV